jgi:hypothetical protein
MWISKEQLDVTIPISKKLQPIKAQSSQLQLLMCFLWKQPLYSAYKPLLFTLPKIRICRKSQQMYVAALVVLDAREVWWCSQGSHKEATMLMW